jgi:hypothetical protein
VLVCVLGIGAGGGKRGRTGPHGEIVDLCDGLEVARIVVHGLGLVVNTTEEVLGEGRSGP